MNLTVIVSLDSATEADKDDRSRYCERQFPVVDTMAAKQRAMARLDDLRRLYPELVGTGLQLDAKEEDKLYVTFAATTKHVDADMLLFHAIVAILDRTAVTNP